MARAVFSSARVEAGATSVVSPCVLVATCSGPRAFVFAGVGRQSYGGGSWRQVGFARVACRVGAQLGVQADLADVAAICFLSVYHAARRLDFVVRHHNPAFRRPERRLRKPWMLSSR